MAKIDRIEQLGDKLAHTTIKLEYARCTHLRDERSSCHVCVEACPAQAIRYSIGQLAIDSELCTNCGSCAEACPVGACITTQPNAGQIVEQARTSAERNRGLAIFICTHDAEAVHIDRSRVVELPCLAYLDEYLVCGMAATGIDRIVVLSKGCEGCSFALLEAPTATLQARLENLQAEFDFELQFLVTDAIPDALTPAHPRGPLIGSQRRDLFTHAGGSALEHLNQAIDETLDLEAANKPIDPATYRSVRMIDMLQRLSTTKRAGFTSSRLWTQPIVDREACLHCGTCAAACPSSALSFVADESTPPHTSLSFEPALCTACGLCRDVCTNRSLDLDQHVRIDALLGHAKLPLFEHEPCKLK